MNRRETIPIQKNVTYTMFGHLGDVVEDDLVRVALDVVGLLVCVEGDGTHDTYIGVIECSMSSEVGSFLLILVFFCHCA